MSCLAAGERFISWIFPMCLCTSPTVEAVRMQMCACLPILLLEKQVMILLWFETCEWKVRGLILISTNVMWQGPWAMHCPVTCPHAHWTNSVSEMAKCEIQKFLEFALGTDSCQIIYRQMIHFCFWCRLLKRGFSKTHRADFLAPRHCCHFGSDKFVPQFKLS